MSAGTAGGRHYAGVLVTAKPGRFAGAVAALASLPDVEVWQRDPGTGRCVVVVETADRAGQEAAFCLVADLPDVAQADLVYHLVDPVDPDCPVDGGNG